MSNNQDSMAETVTEKKMHDHKNASSSSDSVDDRKVSAVSNVFGLMFGGKAADVFLWRDKKVSAGVLCGATAIWLLFEVLEYGLLTLVCHGLILSLLVLFLWSNASTFIQKSPPKIPKIVFPEEHLIQTVSAVRIEINRGLAALRDVALGTDLKKFLSVIAGLWFVSIVGGCCNFLTLAYTLSVLVHTVPVIYEKYEDKIDPVAEKAWIEIKKQYAAFDEKVIGKIPRSLNDKKKA